MVNKFKHWAAQLGFSTVKKRKKKHKWETRSATKQVWLIFIYAIFVTIALLVIGWVKGSPEDFWPSVASIISAIWWPLSIYGAALEFRKARENSSPIKRKPEPGRKKKSIMESGEFEG